MPTDNCIIKCDNMIFIFLIDKKNIIKKFGFCFTVCNHINPSRQWQSLKNRGFQEPMITHIVFNLTSELYRKWGCRTCNLESERTKDHFSSTFWKKILMWYFYIKICTLGINRWKEYAAIKIWAHFDLS